MKQMNLLNTFFLLKNIYQDNLEMMKGSEFVCDYVHSFYIKI